METAGDGAEDERPAGADATAAASGEESGAEGRRGSRPRARRPSRRELELMREAAKMLDALPPGAVDEVAAVASATDAAPEAMDALRSLGDATTSPTLRALLESGASPATVDAIAGISGIKAFVASQYAGLGIGGLSDEVLAGFSRPVLQRFAEDAARAFSGTAKLSELVAGVNAVGSLDAMAGIRELLDAQVGAGLVPMGTSGLLDFVRAQDGLIGGSVATHGVMNAMVRDFAGAGLKDALSAIVRLHGPLLASDALSAMAGRLVSESRPASRVFAKVHGELPALDAFAIVGVAEAWRATAGTLDLLVGDDYRERTEAAIAGALGAEVTDLALPGVGALPSSLGRLDPDAVWRTLVESAPDLAVAIEIQAGRMALPWVSRERLSALLAVLIFWVLTVAYVVAGSLPPPYGLWVSSALAAGAFQSAVSGNVKAGAERLLYDDDPDAGSGQDRAGGNDDEG